MKYEYIFARSIEYHEDVYRIVKVFTDRGHELSRRAADDAWTAASSDRLASWLILPDEDEAVFQTAMKYLKETD